MSDEATTAERGVEEEERNTGAPTSDGRDEFVSATIDEVDERPELFANREISWVDFNDRVLQLAADESVPLLERVKFLAIYAGNLDEFFMVRVAGLHDQVDAGIDARGPDGLSAAEVLEAVTERTRDLTVRQARQFEQQVRPALAREGIEIIACEECSKADLEQLDRHFNEQILPVLTPLAVGPGRPFPYISSLSLSLGVWMRDPGTGGEVFSRVKVPKEVLPRFVDIGNGKFVPLESAMARHIDALFPGMEILHHDVFRVVRDADFTVSDDADDLLRAVEDELRRRRFGEVVRLEVGATIDPELRRRLVDWLGIEEEQAFDVEGLLDLTDLWQLYGLEGHADLRDPPWSPVIPRAFGPNGDQKADLFARIREHDLLVHHPYDSFSGSVERLIRQAVDDPDVLAIKLTVYRTSDDSALVPTLIEAAERGKQAVCLVELKARFDERRNIEWARALEEAGAHVVHGLPGLKTHAKALVIVRREGKGVRRYVHVGTGNYHAKTSRIYEDLGLFTCDPEITSDVAELFNSLTGYGRERQYKQVVVAPHDMREWLLERVEHAIAAQSEHGDARIVMKMNSLVDSKCIRALYRASRAGVRIDLNVRGICCLRPGLDGVSENIRVVSVVGRFLEHARIYAFHGAGEREYWIGSADLMPRNLDTRVELLTPVRSEALQSELEDTLERYLGDDCFAWELEPDGTWLRRRGGQRGAHAELMARAAERQAEAVAPASETAATAR
ncbi:MAG: Polyphosphate kinase [uncultured Solirubrobacterales bacterium]|uniref:Polyphosphate kinase n=1 Tax=uncultured Solirubrobacterales bacterium TaxID=768556 RepID=A0A6J4TDX8_9ACTN|nr:MAG: Polyphosphate kinase [uncultured Solirubrobacterales bacterium]